MNCPACEKKTLVPFERVEQSTEGELLTTELWRCTTCGSIFTEGELQIVWESSGPKKKKQLQ